MENLCEESFKFVLSGAVIILVPASYGKDKMHVIMARNANER